MNDLYYGMLSDQEIEETRSWIIRNRAFRLKGIAIKPSFQLLICDY